MPVEVIEKKKRGLVCAECGHSVAEGEECPECGSSKVKKSLTIIRKSVADSDDELEDDTEVDEEDEDLEDDDDDDEDDDEEDDDDEDEEDEEDDDEDDDEEEDDEELELDVSASVKKSVGLEALNIATALATDVSKVFAKGGTPEDYEQVMTEMNNVMDAAAERWFSGKTVSKSKNPKAHVDVIRARVDKITKGKKVAKKNSKRTTTITKRADLPEDVRKSLEEADAVVEADKQRQWLEVAKGYKDFPGETEDLAKTLRALSESNPKAYEDLKKTLDAGAEVIGKSRLFDSYGSPGAGAPEEVRKNAEMETKAAELVSKGDFKSIEAAKVSLMNGGHYQPTNA